MELEIQNLKSQQKNEPLGDGKAVFLSEGTDGEYEEHMENEERGWKEFKRKIFNL
jgi:hypothetical protein|tara:strand:+ start:1051 stop:1215 length:165 start_codon:yes stop_codon:yes gene_type:complete